MAEPKQKKTKKQKTKNTCEEFFEGSMAYVIV